MSKKSLEWIILMTFLFRNLHKNVYMLKKIALLNFNSIKIPLIGFVVFLCIGVIAWAFKNVMYFYLFSGIGMLDFNTRILILVYPKSRQFFRICLQSIIGLFLLFWIGLVIGVNFQFEQIFFDIYANVVTGALIQLIVARIILPFFFGNAFCSRVCWSGLFFEVANSHTAKPKFIQSRSSILAWGYLVFLIIMAFVVATIWNPGNSLEIRKWCIIGMNIFIVLIGFILSFFVGSRAYCRLLCPFITISGLIAPYSLFKITPVNASNCSSCMKCNNECPMLIPVHSYVIEHKRINHSLCIECERCISVCNKNVLKLTTKNQIVQK